LSDAAEFETPDLSAGTHTIYFAVRDEEGAWSGEETAVLDVLSSNIASTEHIFFCVVDFAPGGERQLEAVLRTIGAVPERGAWRYVNEMQKKTYWIHLVEDIEAMRRALYTRDAHIIVKGHANYGLGAVFTPREAHRKHEVLNDIRFLDDPNIFNYSSPWIAVKVYRMTRAGKWENWWPVFQDGTSAVMPYDFGDPRGDPPYNYYITYRLPGDPVHHKIEPTPGSAVERFPDSEAPAWYSPSGAPPDPKNSDHWQYYIRNPDQDLVWPITCGGSECPQPHYAAKTILFRKELEIDPARLAYKRMMYDACHVDNYYLDTFQRGIMFYSAGSSSTSGSFVYLKAYLEGKSDHEIWAEVQAHEPVYDYYDFTRPPLKQ
jgi:hypothetical protein